MREAGGSFEKLEMKTKSVSQMARERLGEQAAGLPGSRRDRKAVPCMGRNWPPFPDSDNVVSNSIIYSPSTKPGAEEEGNLADELK